MGILTDFKMALRRTLRFIFVQLLYWTGLLRWAKRQVAKRGVVVLTLHRVLPDHLFAHATSPVGMMVRAGSFESLLEYLQRNCQCVSLDDARIPGSYDSRRHSPRVAVTFDDGWKDNYQYAFPLLCKFNVPATIFICPGLAGNINPFWPEKLVPLWWSAQRSGRLEQVARLWSEISPDVTVHNISHSCETLIENLKRLDTEQRDAFLARLQREVRLEVQPTDDGGETALMDWDEMKEMSHHDVTFGSHSNTHQILPQIPSDSVTTELISSKRAIELRFQTCRMFAYPNGDCSETVRAAVAECGYEYAFVNQPGVWNSRSDALSIPRINIWEGKLTSRKKHFSKANLEYSVFWAAYRGQQDHGN